MIDCNGFWGGNWELFIMNWELRVGFETGY
jgi:hypothetical protein